MRNPHGDFIWYELLTTDMEGAARFYAEVFGWDAAPDAPDSHYWMFALGDAEPGGLMELPSEARACGAEPVWLGYVGVDDVDATLAQAVERGAKVLMPPRDIEGFGRFALLEDPQGVSFYLGHGAMDERSRAFEPKRTGHCHWNELATRDPDAALAFFGELFGWRAGESIPLGALGRYQLLMRGEEGLGAVMAVPPGGRPAWTFYFGVEDIDAAARAVTENGGSILQAPTQVPGGVYSAVARDPQGAVFGLVGPRASR